MADLKNPVLDQFQAQLRAAAEAAQTAIHDAHVAALDSVRTVAEVGLAVQAHPGDALLAHAAVAIAGRVVVDEEALGPRHAHPTHRFRVGTVTVDLHSSGGSVRVRVPSGADQCHPDNAHAPRIDPGEYNVLVLFLPVPKPKDT